MIGGDERGDPMKKQRDKKVPFPPPGFGFGGLANSDPTFDPLGSYTGRTPEKFEIPVQDADDL